VKPLSDEDRRTLVRWIDLGCPIDFDFDPKAPEKHGHGWMVDDQRPTLTLTYPKAGVNETLSRIVVGMHDYNSGLDMDSFEVVADFKVNGNEPGKNLASFFKPKAQGVWEMPLGEPLKGLERATLKV